MIVNLRAEGDPEQLKAMALDGLRTGGARDRASPRRSSTASTSGRAGRSRRTGWRRHDDAQAPRILYCHCAYAKVVPPEVKAAVLNGLAEANVEFDAVPDLCEMAARGDARLRELAADGPLKIAACYPRAVKWLFAAAGAQLPEQRGAHLEHAGRDGRRGDRRPARPGRRRRPMLRSRSRRGERRDRPAIPGGPARRRAAAG